MPPPPEVNQARVAAIFAQVGFVLLAALVVYGFVGVTKEGELRRVCSAPCYLRPDYLGAERKAPEFTLKDLKGKPVSLSSYRGKVVILNFWTKTCGPCLEEMPSLAELTQILKDRPDVAVVTISTDEGPDDVRPTLQTVLRAPPPFEVLFDPEAATVQGKFGTRLFPETWILDPRGVIRARFDGGRDWTNPLIVNFVDGLRGGDYCPVNINGKTLEGKGGKICEEMTGELNSRERKLPNSAP